jgi:hypothetical protein
LQYYIGLLQCLRNLGQLSLAVSLVNGMLQISSPKHLYSVWLLHTISHEIGVISKHSQFAPTLSVYGIEAAWRLGRWDLTEQFLAKSPEPTFEVGLARILLALHENNYTVGC